MAKVIRKKDENLESLIKRFKKAINDDNLMEELKNREFYIAPSLKKRLKSEKARKRVKKVKNNKNLY